MFERGERVVRPFQWHLGSLNAPTKFTMIMPVDLTILNLSEKSSTSIQILRLRSNLGIKILIHTIQIVTSFCLF
jgi:hypothetical protein